MDDIEHSIFERRHLIDVCPVCGDFPEMPSRQCPRCDVPADQVWVRIVLENNHRGAVGALEQARLYGEKMRRDADENVRRCGADLIALIDAERGR